jgi:hypothetical protein
MKRITSLFTIVCAASQLYGMEQPFYESSPKENINTALNNLDEIQHIDNLKDFTNLVHMLAEKSNTGTREIAEKCEAPAAKTYLDLVQKLSNTTDINEITKLIQDDADVNFTSTLMLVDGTVTYAPIATARMLAFAIYREDIALIKLLLDSGAKQESAEYYARQQCYPLLDPHSEIQLLPLFVSHIADIEQLLAKAKIA